MNEVSDTLKQQYIDATIRVREVIQVLEDYFTPELVDNNLKDLNTLQPDDVNLASTEIYTIVIKFPELIISNEKNESEKIYDLFVKFNLRNDGCMSNTFKMTRTTFTENQLKSGYVHSHLPRLSNPGNFEYPCLGQGPIKNTIQHLQNWCDLDYWGLFCYELDKYVRVESLTGGPYIKMRDIGVGYEAYLGEFTLSFPTLINGNSKWQKELNSFIKYLIKSKTLKFAFHSGQYTIADSPVKYYTKINDLFIEYINTYRHRNKLFNYSSMLSSGVLSPYFISSLKISSPKSYCLTYNTNEILFTFKGEPQVFKVLTTDDTQLKYTINTKLVDYIITKILLFVNYEYYNY